MVLSWVVLPAVGALIGWLTNYLAVRLIFRPHRPWRIPLTPFDVQGLLPRRQRDLARSIAAIVEEELLPADELLRLVAEKGLNRDLAGTIAAAAERRTRSRLPAVVPPPLAQSIAGWVGDLVEKEAFLFLEEAIRDLEKSGLTEHLHLAELVERKVAELDVAHLEALALGAAGRELRHIVLLGAVLGFIIGLIQASLLSLWQVGAGLVP